MRKRLMDGRLITSLFLIVVTVSACQPFGFQGRSYPSTIGTFRETGDYRINPKTILESLDQGETNVFIPILATPGPDMPLLPADSVPWTQSDYLKIANALSRLVWKETLAGWSVYYLAFDRECQDNPRGFDSADIIYYKTIEVNWQKVYTARYIQIYPLASEVRWGGGTNFPISDRWKDIDLAKFQISADDALRIGEENGGKEARSRVGNDCSISISTPDHNNDDRWDVGYYYNVHFELIVDPYSGKHEIPTPSP